MKVVVRMLAVSACLISIGGCAGVSLTKSGEDDAQAACKALASIQGDDVTIEQGIAGMARASDLAATAAAANDDYQLLASAMIALNESMLVGSEDLAQSAWANAVDVCNNL